MIELLSTAALLVGVCAGYFAFVLFLAKSIYVMGRR
jgi:hypothetical protein